MNSKININPQTFTLQITFKSLHTLCNSRDNREIQIISFVGEILYSKYMENEVLVLFIPMN